MKQKGGLVTILLELTTGLLMHVRGNKFPVNFKRHTVFLFSSDRKGGFSHCNEAGVWVVGIYHPDLSSAHH